MKAVHFSPMHLFLLVVLFCFGTRAAAQTCSVTITGPSSVCGQPLQASAVVSPNNTNYTYSWSPANLFQNANNVNAFGFFGGPGYHNQLISVTVTDTVSGCTATDTMIQSAYMPILGTYYVCPGDSLLMDFGAGGLNYIWQGYTDTNNVNIPLNITTQTLYVSEPGTYYGIAFFPNCTQTSAFTIVDSCLSSSNCSVTITGPSSVCGQPLQASALVSPNNTNYTYSWSPANLFQNANNVNAFGFFGGPGYHNQLISVTVTDTVSGCTATDTMIQSAYMPIFGTYYVCPGDSILMDFGPGGISYNWQFYIDTNNVQVPLNLTSQTIYVTEPGQYVGFAVFPNNCILTSSFAVIDSCLSTNCSVFAGNDTVFCQQQGQLNATPGSAGNYTYSWSPATGLSNPNVQNPYVINGVHNQQYVVTMTDAQNNCTATDTVIVSAYYFYVDSVYMCNNQPVTLDLGPGGLTYIWQFFTDTAGNITNLNIPTQTLTVNQEGSYAAIAFFPGCGMLTSIFYVIDSCNVSVPNVWPGDCNYDLTANMADALHIGLAYNTSGSTRPNATNGWYAQPMTDWSQNYSNCNYKHGDSNGDGLINVNDTLAISLNYAQSHPFRMQQPPVVDPLTTPTLELVANYDTCGLQTQVTVDIRLGSAAIPVDSIYGISFRITSDAYLIDTTLTFVNLNNTWLGTPGTDMFHFRKHFPSSAIMDIAEAGTNHQNRINGNGSIGSFVIVTTDNLSGIAICHFDLSDVTAVTVSQQYLTMNLVNDSVVIDPSVPAGVRPEISNTFELYPNPANENVIVKSSTIADQIEVCDMTGRVIASVRPNATITSIETGSLANGVYFLRFINGNNISTQKLTISH
jgi:hypothetical protein